jgi:hypothetical protein
VAAAGDVARDLEAEAYDAAVGQVAAARAGDSARRQNQLAATRAVERAAKADANQATADAVAQLGATAGQVAGSMGTPGEMSSLLGQMTPAARKALQSAYGG